MIRRYIARLIEREVSRINRERPEGLGGRVGRQHAMEYAFEFAAKSGLDGHYIEFGCYRGDSLLRAHRAYHKYLRLEIPGKALTKRKMFVFDSFEGLPPLQSGDRMEGYDVFEAGQYSCSLDDFLARVRSEGVDPDDLVIVPGYYQSTLRNELKALHQLQALVVHIDCDLYSSAVTVLDFLRDVAQDGTVILFDDYLCYRGNPAFGVRRAFREWLAQTSIETTPYFDYSWAGRVFILHTPTDRASAYRPPPETSSRV